MKKLLEFSSVMIVLFLLAMLSCSKLEVQTVNQSTPAGNLSDKAVDRTDPGGVGHFLYKQLRYHVFHFDPYQLLALDQRSVLKQKFDELKANPKDYHAIWQQAAQNKQVSVALSNAIIKFHENLDQLVHSREDLNVDAVEKWFTSQLAYNLERTDLSTSDNDFLMRHQSLMRYAVKAYIEALPKPLNQTATRARVASDNCGTQQFNCYQGNISTYAGIGALFSGTSVAGAVVGIVVGTIVSFVNCHCDANPCSSPIYVSTDGNNCYNSNVGLPMIAGGYGSNAQGFRWLAYKSDNMIEANKLTDRFGGDHFTIPDSDIQGNPVVYIQAVTNCSPGVEYGTDKLLKVDLQYTLGWPDFYMTGPTSAPAGSSTTYGLNGVNLDNVQWNIWTYNQANGVFTYQSNAAATIQWNNIPGYVHVTATATTDCGTDTDGVYVQTQ